MTLRGLLEILIKKEINKFQIYSLQGTVTNVNEDARTCSVLVDTTTYTNVLLQAVYTFETGLVLIPSVDSVVTVTFKTLESVFVSQYTQLDKVICEATGMKFINGDSGLKNTLKNLINAILALTVPTGTGPSGVPINASDFQDILKDLDNYLLD